MKNRMRQVQGKGDRNRTADFGNYWRADYWESLKRRKSKKEKVKNEEETVY